MKNLFRIENGILMSYIGNEIEIVIPDGVVAIGNYAFQECKLQKITIPEGVIEIGKRAFSECCHLSTIILPSTLLIINDNAFYKCINLKTVALPPNLKYLGESAFFKSGIKHIVIPDSVIEMGRGIFANCHQLHNIQLPAGMTNIPDYMFYNSMLKEISLPSITRIGKFAFAATQLVTVNAIHCKCIDSYAFADCESMSEIKLNKTVDVIENSFEHCPNMKRFVIKDIDEEDMIIYLV